MTGPANQEPAYVLHRRPYRETSLMVDLFTLNAGRLTVVARGASAARSPLKAQLQPFQPLLVDWRGRSDLKTLTQVEPRPGVALGQGRCLFSGFYLNELLQRLLPAGDAHPELFAAYIGALQQLSRDDDVEPVLRRFEVTLAATMGYGFAWDRVTDTGAPVQPDAHYCYDPQQGLQSRPGPETRLRQLPGATLLALAGDDYESAASRRLAKQAMRVLVDFLLQGRPLHSRALFSRGAPTITPGDSHD